ncbi:hypothetical protein KIH74_06330 [Kineosporia sp. J2-2]|uniref:CdiI immunity protein domain-containing protein n=1 Tax=Kineosporia corallincola TaxID=2835133 RepID=A0ABS5TG01_9ACTN|nr:hypothetical protein [Kineosporia corallincola]MBT0768534.1 hypothetical protein [Kineosporia corallincola]
MASAPDTRTFLELSGDMMDVNSLIRGWEDHFVHQVANLRDESLRQSFRRGFAHSVTGGLTPQEYERATGWDFDTPAELHEHLRTLWTRFYGDADPRDSLT